MDTYELDEGLGAELERRWTRPDDRSSLRDLAEYFNKRLLRAALDTTVSNPLDGEIDNLYRLLTDDDVTSGVRQETRGYLEQRGVDVDALEADFVSYQAVRTYLRTHRGVDHPERSRSSDDHRNSKRETVQQLISRLRIVTTEALGELVNAGNLTLGDFEVTVTVHVHCADCDTRVPVTDLISRGGCQC